MIARRLALVLAVLVAVATKATKYARPQVTPRPAAGAPSPGPIAVVAPGGNGRVTGGHQESATPSPPALTDSVPPAPGAAPETSGPVEPQTHALAFLGAAEFVGGVR